MCKTSLWSEYNIDYRWSHVLPTTLYHGSLPYAYWSAHCTGPRYILTLVRQLHQSIAFSLQSCGGLHRRSSSSSAAAVAATAATTTTTTAQQSAATAASTTSAAGCAHRRPSMPQTKRTCQQPTFVHQDELWLTQTQRHANRSPPPVTRGLLNNAADSPTDDGTRPKPATYQNLRDVCVHPKTVQFFSFLPNRRRQTETTLYVSVTRI